METFNTRSSTHLHQVVYEGPCSPPCTNTVSLTSARVQLGPLISYDAAKHRLASLFELDTDSHGAEPELRLRLRRQRP